MSFVLDALASPWLIPTMFAVDDFFTIVNVLPVPNDAVVLTATKFPLENLTGAPTSKEALDF
jgi:hypothetical protein